MHPETKASAALLVRVMASTSGRELIARRAAIGRGFAVELRVRSNGLGRGSDKKASRPS
jgi:hypothetical protein